MMIDRPSARTRTAPISVGLADDALCRILEEDDELAQAVPADQRALADRTGIGLLMMSGLMIRRVGIDGRFGAELLGESDLLRPWQQAGPEASMDRTIGWRVLVNARIAVLDRRVARSLAQFPDLTRALVARALTRSRNLAVTMATVHQPHVDVRLHMLFWHLADRWGR
jgi:CRP/FNR family cyclic AMP-dependent transcriptional regulator